ncbi:MAG: class A beta-lactamase-related serine hydrolase [Sphingobium sp.]|nr:class A beta-lactamase-related serine hydrolase [Sphingobium sp.]
MILLKDIILKSNLSNDVQSVFSDLCDKYVAHHCDDQRRKSRKSINNTRIDADSSKVDLEAAATASKFFAPHVDMMLSVDGEVQGRMCCGAARADGTALADDALYRIASMTKPVTIAASLQMAEEGRLALDQPVADILPEFAALHLWSGALALEGGFLSRPLVPSDGPPMTIYDLMRHTSGLSYSVHQADALDGAYAGQGLDAFHQRRTSVEHVAALAALPLRFVPGQRFHYSASIDLLGAVMERIEGRRIEEILSRRIFAPLGMEDSFFTVPPEKLGRLTDAWMLGEGGSASTLYDRGGRSRWRFTPKSASAGGGLISSTQDYHQFLLMLMNDGIYAGARILSPESVALMLRNHLPSGGDLTQEGDGPLSETRRPGIGMGLGGAIVLDAEKAGLPGGQGCYYWGGLLSTGFFMDKARKMIGLVMTQMMPSGATSLREDFRRGVYQALLGDIRKA